MAPISMLGPFIPLSFPPSPSPFTPVPKPRLLSKRRGGGGSSSSSISFSRPSFSFSTGSKPPPPPPAPKPLPPSKPLSSLPGSHYLPWYTPTNPKAVIPIPHPVPKSISHPSNPKSNRDSRLLIPPFNPPPGKIPGYHPHHDPPHSPLVNLRPESHTDHHASPSHHKHPRCDPGCKDALLWTFGAIAVLLVLFVAGRCFVVRRRAGGVGGRMGKGRGRWHGRWFGKKNSKDDGEGDEEGVELTSHTAQAGSTISPISSGTSRSNAARQERGLSSSHMDMDIDLPPPPPYHPPLSIEDIGTQRIIGRPRPVEYLYNPPNIGLGIDIRDFAVRPGGERREGREGREGSFEDAVEEVGGGGGEGDKQGQCDRKDKRISYNSDI